MSGEGVEVRIEVTLFNSMRVVVSGKDKDSLVKALKAGIEAAKEVSEELGQLVTATQLSVRGNKSIPINVLEKLRELNHRDRALLLLYFEGPMSKEQINQRSREIGKEITKDWLDTEFYKSPTRELFVAETGQDGVKRYRLSELGRIEAEKVLAKLTQQVSVS